MAPPSILGIISDCLAACEREQIGSPCPVVDHEVRRDEAADRFTVWLICRDRPASQAFADTERSRFAAALRRRLLAAGVDEGTVDSLALRVTSRDEVSQRGGYSFL